MKKRLFGCVFAIFPVVLLFVGNAILSTRGPFYIGDLQDPNYPYLFNSLNVATGKTPGHYDHPGTTVQEIGGITIWATYGVECLLRGCPEKGIKFFVIRESERCLRNAAWAIFGLISVSMWFAAWLAYRAGLSPWICVLIQLIPFLFNENISNLGKVCPEPVLLAGMLFYLGLYASRRTRETDKIAPKNRDAVHLGAVYGFSMATKLTFGPTGLLLLTFKKHKQKWFAILAGVLSFIIFTIPAHPKRNNFYEWIGVLLSGKSGGVGLDQIWETYWRLFFVYDYYAQLAIGSIVCAVLFHWMRIQQNKFFWISFALFLQPLIMTRRANAGYLFPVLYVFAGVVLVELALLIRDRSLAKGQRFIALGITAFFGVWLINGGFIATQQMRSSLRQYADSKELYLLPQKKFTECSWIPYYTASDRIWALHYGNGYSDSLTTSELLEEYPGRVFYYTMFRTFSGFRDLLPRAELKKRIKSGECFYLYGNKAWRLNNPEFMRNIQYKVLDETGPEGVYLLEDPMIDPHAPYL